MKPSVTKYFLLGGLLLVLASIVSNSGALASLGLSVIGIGILTSFIKTSEPWGWCNWWWIRADPIADALMGPTAHPPVYMTTRSLVTLLGAGLVVALLSWLEAVIPGFPWLSEQLPYIGIFMSLMGIGLAALRHRSETHPYWTKTKRFHKVNGLRRLP